MRRLLTTTALLGIGVACASHATAQGPVREGLRRTGEIAAEGTAASYSGNGDKLLRAVGQGTLNAAGATAQGVRQGVDAVTPVLPLQARGDANLSAAEQRRDARWRFARHNGEWWYYSPENRWMYHRNGDWNEFAEDRFQPLPQQGQRYAMGYRGVDPAAQGDQPTQWDQSQQVTHQVRTDRWGRQYICENGRPVYLDQSGFERQSADYNMNQAQGGDGTQDYAPPRPAEAGPATAEAAPRPSPPSSPNRKPSFKAAACRRIALATQATPTLRAMPQSRLGRSTITLTPPAVPELILELRRFKPRSEGSPEFDRIWA